MDCFASARNDAPLDSSLLAYAIRLGNRGLGRTWPNPSVGCVLVKDGNVIAAARTADGGRPHAETIALASAGEAARGATAYVSLEPCAHHGKTPPCAQSLVDAGIARVVIAAIDPDPRVSGQGIALLKAAGITTTLLTTHHSPLTIHKGFFSRIQRQRPYVMMKLATSADGQMADISGKSQWITGEVARAHGHGLRSTADAILTGIGTVLADNPMLNVRLPGIHHPRLVRVVADRTLRVPLDAQLVKTAEALPTWIITTPEAVEQAASHAHDLRERGVNIIAPEEITPATIISVLAEAGITRLLVEAGPTLSTAFLAAGAIDRLYWYRAPILLGDAGNPAIHALDTQLQTAARHRPTDSIQLGDDRCDVWEIACLQD